MGRLKYLAMRAEPETQRRPPDSPRRSLNPIWQRMATHDPLEREAEEVARDISADADYASAHAEGAPRGGDARLTPALQRFFGRRLGADFADVRLHAGPGDAAVARSLDAAAFTIGSDIAIDSDRHGIDGSEGRELLAHEMVHAAQQSPDAGARVRYHVPSGSVVQRRPAELIDGFSFLGNAVEGGLNPTLRDRLVAVEAHLQSIYDGLGAAHPDRVKHGGGAKSLRDWAGITAVRSWRPDSRGLKATSFHASGSAVDVNYNLQPYIATRTTVGGTPVYGGEAAGAHLQAERQAATDVYDRAMAFEHGGGRAADVSSRKAGESTGAAYRRLSAADQALSRYLRHAFLEEPKSVKRAPVPNAETANEATLLSGIPTTERRPEAQAIGDLEALMGNTFDAGLAFQRSHPNWPYSPRQQYFRMLRDYELVRVPMQRGNPSASPTDTRNPTRGFLHMRREFVEAMVDIGRLRWGAVDLGPHTSGDVHHFDLGNHGGVTPDGS